MALRSVIYTWPRRRQKRASLSPRPHLWFSPVVPVTPQLFNAAKIHLALLGNNRTRRYLSHPQLLTDLLSVINVSSSVC